MKKLHTLLFITMICSLASFAQSADDMKAWQAYMTPGDIHKMLSKGAGTWNDENKMWMAPGQPPMESKSVSVCKPILGGRYIQTTSKGKFQGMDFEGISTTGYDNAKKVFFNTWVDNMGTGIMTSEGTWDPATKSVTFKGKMVDPMSGKDVDFREVYTVVDENTHKLEMYNAGKDGSEFKSMEMISRRAK